MINTPEEHAAAMVRIEQLMNLGEGNLTNLEAAQLSYLAANVEAYENIHHNIGLPTKEEAAAFRAEQEKEPNGK